MLYSTITFNIQPDFSSDWCGDGLSQSAVQAALQPGPLTSDADEPGLLRAVFHLIFILPPVTSLSPHHHYNYPWVSFADGAKDFLRGDLFRFKDGSSKLLSGNKFQDRFIILRDEKLLLYKDVKVSGKAELHRRTNVTHAHTHICCAKQHHP